MRKILAGFIVALVIGIPAVYFGVPWWAEQKALRELDAALESVRRAGGTASRGAAHFDLWTRTLKVADLSLRSRDPAKGAVKIGQVTATGLAGGDSRFSAESLDLTDMEITGLQWGEISTNLTYTIPKLTAEHVAGPTILSAKPAAIAGADDALAALSTFAALSAAKVTIPNAKVENVIPEQGAIPFPITVTYDIADAVLEGIERGRITSATVARMATQSRLPDNTSVTGEAEKIAASDIDLNPVIAALDPAQPKDDNFHPIYRQVVFGRYTLNLGATGMLRMDSIVLDDFAIRPWKLFDPSVLAFTKTLSASPGVAASPKEIAETLDKFATLYEGFKFSKLEARGFSADFGTKTPSTIGVMRLAGFDAGKIAELAVENVAINPPTGEATNIGWFAFKSIDFVKLMRSLAQAAASPSPGLEQALAMLSTLQGIELKNFKGVERTTQQPLQIEGFDLSWGQFVGAIPSQIRATTKFTTMVDPNGNDPNLRYLIEAGIKDVTFDIDFGAGWNENARAIAVTPLTATISKVVGFSATANLANVPATIFSANPLAFGVSLAQVEAGPLDITLRDLGVVDLIAAQLARDQNTTPETMRTRLVEMALVMASGSPELDTIGTALIQLIQKRGTTLNVKLTPKARINLLQSIEIARIDPIQFLSQFKVEAKTER